MKRHMLLGAAAIVLVCAGKPAAAQGLPVHDNASNVARVIEAGRALQQAIQQYNMLKAAYGALAHTTDATGMLSILGGPTRTFMPEAGQVMGLLAGSGSVYGAANALQGVSRMVDVGDSTPFAAEMQRRELATANVKAIALSGMQFSQDAISRLSGMLDRISGSEDVTEAVAVGDALQVEQQNIAQHNTQIAQLQVALLAENRVDQQRAEQQRWDSASTLVNNTQPLGALE